MTRWLSHLRAERRLSPKTLEAYRRDLRQFLEFLAEHWGAPVTLPRFAQAGGQRRPRLHGGAARRRDRRPLADAGAGRAALVRAVSRARRQGAGSARCRRFARRRSKKSLPKPIQIAGARRLADADERAGENREPWIWARDAAVMALLYGSGLRISEALGLKRRDVPAPGAGDTLIVLGKGNKTRMVPVLQNVLALIADYAASCPHPLPPEGPMFVGARGGPLSPRIIQLTMERMRGALGLPDSAHAARAAPLLCDASADPRRRSARDPGVARPRLAVDHAGLYRHRYRAAVRGLQDRASARLDGARMVIDRA